ncbi:MAG TPA: HmuY family protein [Polyangiaceae bacterium]|nr:HmuY family protein [Polyangiaceae bacterium]
MVINIIKAWQGAALLLGLAACGGQDATTLSATSGAAEPAGSDPSAPTDVSVQESTASSPPVVAEVLQSQHVQTQRLPDGSFASEVNATDPQRWVYFSLQSRQEVTPELPERSPSWDLGFQRSNVKVNSGASGAGNVRVAVASGPFESLSEAPAGGYLADAADTDLDGSSDYAFSAGDGWYDYDPATHLLTARDTVFVVQTPGGAFKLQFSSYYDRAGTPGMPQFRWAPLGS